MSTNTSEILGWAQIAAQAADEKKGTDPVILDMGDLFAVTDAFVIVSAPNNRLVVSIAEEIEYQIKLAGGPKPRSIEGLADASWVLIDFGVLVVHVFQQEVREFYDIERLWKEAPRVSWTPKVGPEKNIDSPTMN